MHTEGTFCSSKVSIDSCNLSALNVAALAWSYDVTLSKSDSLIFVHVQFRNAFNFACKSAAMQMAHSQGQLLQAQLLHSLPAELPPVECGPSSPQ